MRISAVKEASSINFQQNKTSFQGGMGVSVTYLGTAGKDMFTPTIARNAKTVLQDFQERMPRAGQFLQWVNVPENQLNKWGTDRIFKAVNELKNASPAQHLTVIGIGGSKHTIEAAIGSSSLPGRRNIHFYSKIDDISLERFKEEIGGSFKNSNYEIVSKSGTTFEPEDALMRINSELVKEYIAEGHSAEEAQKLADKHFVAITDKNAQNSKLRRTAIAKGYVGQNLCVHDDVGGRFSTLDDHVLFALIYAGATKQYIKRVLQGAVKMTKSALNSDLEQNIPMQRAMFYVHALTQGRKSPVQLVMEDPLKFFKDWLLQMKNESLKDTDFFIMECPEGMHHSAEALFHPSNQGKYSVTVTTLNTKGKKGFANPNGYIGSIDSSFENRVGPTCLETLDVEGTGISPEALGAYAQMKHFETVYQGMLRRETIAEYAMDIPKDKAIEEVTQSSVELYKKDMKGLGYVTAGSND